MKRIELVMARESLDAVQEALKAVGIADYSVKYGRYPVAHGPLNPEGATLASEHLNEPDLEPRLVIVASAERAAEVIRAFASPEWRSLIGDGKMFVYEVSEPVRSRDPDPSRHPDYR
jgi:nitrogen regulatory protein PII